MTLTKVTSKSIKDGEIVNADLHSAAAIATTKLAKPIDLADNEKIRFGGEQDLEIYHDTNDSIISDGGTGNLLLKTNGGKVGVTTGGGVEIANFKNNGKCELYYQGDQKFFTDQFGATITNNAGGTAQLRILAANNANAKIELASDNSDDNGDEWTISNVGATQRLTFYTDIGGSTSERLSLTTDGDLDIHNHLLMESSNQEIRLGPSAKLKIYWDGSNSYIKEPNSVSGQLIIDGYNGTDIRQGSTGDLMGRFSGGGAVSLYHDNNLRFSTTTSGCSMERDASGADLLFQIINQDNSAGSDTILRLKTVNTTAHCRLQFGDTGNNDTGLIDYDHANNDMTFSCNGVQQYEMDGGAFHPVPDNARDLGRSGNRWDDVRATNTGIVSSSDRNVKNTIVESDLGLDFVNKLKPVSYKLNVGKSGRTHYGLISQDIEELLSDFSKTPMDFAGFCKDTITVDTDMNELDTPKIEYSLRYTEFISPMIKAIQELSAKVAALEAA